MTEDEATRIVERVRAIWPRPVMTDERAAEWTAAILPLLYAAVNGAVDRLRDSAQFCPSIADLTVSALGKRKSFREQRSARCRRMVDTLAQLTLETIAPRDRMALEDELLLDMPDYWDGSRLRELSQQIRDKIGDGASFEQWATEAGWWTHGKETLPIARLLARANRDIIQALTQPLADRLASEQRR